MMEKVKEYTRDGAGRGLPTDGWDLRGMRAALLGCAVGDALGVPHEFRPRGSFEVRGMEGFGTHGQPAGTWSDDTSMTLATCLSLTGLGRVDADDMRRRFRGWLVGRPEYSPDARAFDVGLTTSEALREGRGLDGEATQGNGSLMRIAPLAFCGATDAEVASVSGVTHAHPACVTACQLFVRQLRDARSDPDAFWGALAPLREEPEGSVRSGGWVMDTLHAATWCVANSDEFEGAVTLAVSLGDDSDTTGAVTGALAATLWGGGSIPEGWLDALRGRELLEAPFEGGAGHEGVLQLRSGVGVRLR